MKNSIIYRVLILLAIGMVGNQVFGATSAPALDLKALEAAGLKKKAPLDPLAELKGRLFKAYVRGLDDGDPKAVQEWLKTLSPIDQKALEGIDPSTLGTVTKKVSGKSAEEALAKQKANAETRKQEEEEAKKKKLAAAAAAQSTPAVVGSAAPGNTHPAPKGPKPATATSAQLAAAPAGGTLPAPKGSKPATAPGAPSDADDADDADETVVGAKAPLGAPQTPSKEESEGPFAVVKAHPYAFAAGSAAVLAVVVLAVIKLRNARKANQQSANLVPMAN